MNGRERQASGEAAGGRAGINPREFKGGQRQRKVLRSGDVSALFGIHEDGGDAGLIERLEQDGFLLVPLVSGTRALRDQARNRAAGHFAHRLHQHLQVVAIGEAPKNLADVVVG